MTGSRERILETLAAHRVELRRRGVRRLGLFGSAARDEDSAESDVDLVVELERKSFDGYMQLKDFLETLLGRRVDLVLAEAVKPRLRGPILEEALHAPGL